MHGESVGDTATRFLRARSGEPVTASEVAKGIGCVRRTAHKHLTRLAEGGVVETKKVGARARVWWLPGTPVEPYERVTDAFFAVDTEWRFTHLNEGAERLLGRDGADLVGRELWTAFPTTVDTEFESAYRRAMTTGESVSFEERYPPLDETFAVQAYPSPTGLTVCFREVSERIERERELRDRMRQQRVVARLGQSALATTDVDEFMQEVCEAVSETLDTDYAKVLDLDDESDRLDLRAGVGWDEGVVGTASVPADTNSQAGYTLKQRAPVRVRELSAETRFSGPELLTDHDVESGISVIVGSLAAPWGILGTHDTAVREFTERDADFVRSVATLLASAVDRRERERELELYEAVFETLSDGVYAVDTDGEFTLVNESYVRMTGVPRSELVGSHVSRLVDEEVRAAAKELEVELVSGAREQATLEAELTDANGETFPAAATFSLLETADGYERIGVVRDVTERRRYEERLQRQRDRLERLNQLALRVFDAIRGLIRAETRERIERAVCERLVDGDVYREAAIGPLDWASGDVTTGTGTPWAATEWGTSVPELVVGATEGSGRVASDGVAAAVGLTYDGRSFGTLVLRSERPGGFGADERALLTELGRAVGLAISAVERKNVLVNDSVARLAFESKTLAEPFTDVAGEDVSMGIVLDRIVPLDDDTYVVHYSVDGVPPETFVTAVEGFETVQRARVVNDETGRRVEARTTGAALVTQFRRFDGRVRSLGVEGNTLSLTVDVPVETVRETVETVIEAYPDLDLRAQRTVSRDVRTPAEFRSIVDDRLTKRQCTALELAYFGGYFDWPRSIDGEALSEKMGIAPPTFHKHLRLAERRVFDSLYEEPATRG
jgi:PAS domain S-box-containing protein